MNMIATTRCATLSTASAIQRDRGNDFWSDVQLMIYGSLISVLLG
jgi:hypothetical protein